MDRSFVEQNRASTQRIRAMANRLSNEEMQTRVGEHWTVSILMAHLAFWDRRVIYVLQRTEQDGKVFVPEIGVVVNDVSLPLWAAIPAGEAKSLAIEWAAACDKRLEEFSPELLKAIYNYNQRWVVRALHRNEHLDEADAALKKR